MPVAKDGVRNVFVLLLFTSAGRDPRMVILRLIGYLFRFRGFQSAYTVQY